jgi:hypothetical protein
MSFNYHARRARNSALPINYRRSSLLSCVLRLGWLVKQNRGTLCNYFELNVQKQMDESQLLDKLTAIEVFRNRFLKRQQNFERKRLREKMRGRRQPRKKDVQALYEIKELEQKDNQSPLSANKNLSSCLFL